MRSVRGDGRRERPHRRSLRSAPLIVPLLILLLATPAALGAPGLLGLAGTTTIDGILAGEAGPGAVHVRDRGLPISFELRADHLWLTMNHSQGGEFGPPQRPNYVRYIAQSGTTEATFDNVTVTLTPFNGPMELLLKHRGTADLSARSPVEVPDELPSYLTRVGWSPETRSATGDPPTSAWFEPPPSWTMVRGVDEARVTGDVTMFVNNATATIARDDEVLWQNWTGYKTSDETPVSRRYEQRMLWIDLNGTDARLRAPNGLTLLGQGLTLDLDGAIDATRAQGTLQQATERILLDREPLKLEGIGRVALTRAQNEALLLRIHDVDDFAVTGGLRVPVEPGPASTDWWQTVLVTALGLVAVAGAAWLHPRVRQVWRGYRYEYWSRRGHEHVDQERFAQAASAFERATRAAPARAIGWHQLTLAHLRDGSHQAALEAVGRAWAHEVPREARLTELEVRAALRAGDVDRCRATVEALAAVTPAGAARLVRTLGLGEDVLGERLVGPARRSDERCGDV